MNRFKYYTTCVKCGVKSHHKVEYINQIIGIRYEKSLLRACNICGYRWKEKPLDSKE